MAEERKELKELKERTKKIERILEQMAGAGRMPSPPPATSGTGVRAPWEELINRPGPVHDPYAPPPPDRLLARGQQWIYNELLRIRSLLEEILKEVKK